jgi:hypothetical protein
MLVIFFNNRSDTMENIELYLWSAIILVPATVAFIDWMAMGPFIKSTRDVSNTTATSVPYKKAA